MKRILLVVLAFLSIGLVKAQDAATDKYKSLFTLNFIRYVDWPEAAKQGDFVIGVVRNSNLAKNLSSSSEGKKFGYQNIVVKEFKKIEDVTDCQILYVSGTYNYQKNASELAAKLKNKNSLIITESKGAIDNGAMINFVIVDNKLKFELSEQNAKNFGLGFSNSLTAMASAITK